MISRPVILWNHRWEYDKDPVLFFETLYQLSDEGLDFGLVVLGACFSTVPSVFTEAAERLSDHILHWGFTKDQSEYYHWLWRANLVISTSRQDFFGISVVEAIYCQCWPILPNRLALPEHIPDDLIPQCLYESPMELIDQIKQAIKLSLYLSEDRIRLSRYVYQRYNQNDINENYSVLFHQLSREQRL